MAARRRLSSIGSFFPSFIRLGSRALASAAATFHSGFVKRKSGKKEERIKRDSNRRNVNKQEPSVGASQLLRSSTSGAKKKYISDKYRGSKRFRKVQVLSVVEVIK